MAYLILAHENAAQLDALLSVLVPPASPDVAIVHADKRSALWQALRRRPADPSGRVRVIADPVAVRWGHMSQVEAIARLVRDAAGTGCDYAHLISGADWPAVTRADLAAQLASSGGLCHVEAIPGHHEERMETFRFDTPWLRLDPRRDARAYAVTWELRRLARWLDAARAAIGARRSLPYGRWHYGSQWWSLPADALALLARELPRLLASTRLWGTVCSDEHVVPTIIAQAFPARLAGHRRFIRFPPGQSSPRLLDAGDRHAIAESEAWFIRKVATAHDPFFLTMPAAITLPEPISVRDESIFRV
ncbi:beta-1,6-N-acetylglucosaminyltransferase [Novosphingobium album (ex Liu et al. 2023)]|uniref:Beta-1,6-N-acetylglucosaminyltransferase n=1 Tax=Novosphingobium album (ex Liu et al. 2023) TaxID=3031130 RepID=A0ABT5WT04_9SPHN|nr:beta-1,6-N-acetylglucosaminyltransferase [Novosphingobium album (ex Liu et al. 2023)]MDE8653162.1 beta-1,6-N-acetylglucosaminyltransferase [Novosphingobium album (ex Liu et al. 2023)]